MQINQRYSPITIVLESQQELEHMVTIARAFVDFDDKLCYHFSVELYNSLAEKLQSS